MSDEEKKLEDMPLADLLGMAENQPERVQERDDEPGSGIAKLAQMVAASSVADAKRPSIGPDGGPAPSGQVPSMPPPMGSVPPPAGSMPPPGGSFPPPAGSIPPPPGSIPPPGGSFPPAAEGAAAPAMGSAPPGTSVPPMGSVPPGGALGNQPAQAVPAMGAGGAMGATETAGVPAMGTGIDAYAQDDGLADAAVPRKKSNLGIFIAIGAVIVVAGVTAAVVMSGGDESEGAGSEQIAQLESQLNELKTAKEKLADAERQALEVAAEAEAAKAAEAEKAAAEAASAEAQEADESEEDAPVEAEEEEPASKKGAKGKRRRSVVRKAKPASAKKTTKKEASKEKPKNELGALLDNDVASGKKAPTGALPKTPSRAQVKTAMRPIMSRAAKCAKYSKGTVKLKITVGSNGRVTSSSPVGGNAGATAGNCVAMIARTAKFPRFSNPSFTFNYPIKLK